MEGKSDRQFVSLFTVFTPDTEGPYSDYPALMEFARPQDFRDLRWHYYGFRYFQFGGAAQDAGETWEYEIHWWQDSETDEAEITAWLDAMVSRDGGLMIVEDDRPLRPSDPLLEDDF